MLYLAISFWKDLSSSHFAIVFYGCPSPSALRIRLLPASYLIHPPLSLLFLRLIDDSTNIPPLHLPLPRALPLWSSSPAPSFLPVSVLFSSKSKMTEKQMRYFFFTWVQYYPHKWLCRCGMKRLVVHTGSTSMIRHLREKISINLSAVLGGTVSQSSARDSNTSHDTKSEAFLWEPWKVRGHG